MSGASIQKMSMEIADTMQVGEFAATRLIRTETTYVANMAELAAYKEAGVEKLMFLATLDSRTSDICRSNDGNIVLVEKAVPGENIPPLHPNCRSTTIEVFEDDDLSKLKRRARDPETGKNKTIPANITYKEWYEENVVNNPKAQAEEKKFKNRASDKKQFERYKEILGNKVPKSFDMFQELKYNNANEWKKLEQLYSDTKSGKVWLSADFSSDKKFNMHVEKHLKEYGDITKEEYLNIARELLASPVKGDIEGFKSKLGFVFRYNKAINDFALGRADGKISTLFKPKDGYKYWVEQVEKYKEE
ncbi:SPP1 gp7 family putative phage head morphogenesis protein [Fonticella tunisiensis]|uniref:SPP1 gp7 family putative phage head morphogenesis protein n=2 Tax=Fonticella tunisiensis TaxID=1096341 RepID=A0A4R7K6G5_9CLOT|nr:SPP1 gp7 family putative phage head morphogenesis protein [Fonticella tunisiensis]